jgi:hypothetical protein
MKTSLVRVTLALSLLVAAALGGCALSPAAHSVHQGHQKADAHAARDVAMRARVCK